MLIPSTFTLALLALGFVGVLASPISLTARGSAPAIQWTNCSQNVPSTLDTSGVNLSSLPSTLHCGRISVPLDYSNPFGANNTVTLGLAMHRPAKPQGVIFYNAGGSDPNVVVAWQTALNQSQAFANLLDFDLLMLDTRGTFSSVPLNVSLATVGPIESPYPTNETEFKAFKSASSAFIQSWIASSSPPGIIAHVGTREYVQDVEVIRVALGYEKINFIGSSYGGYRAMQYAATFPSRVGRFLLDHAMPHGRGLYAESADNIAGQTRLIERVDSYCLQNSSCPFYAQGKGGATQAFVQALALAANGSLACTACGGPPSAWDFEAGILATFSGEPDFPLIAEILFLAVNASDASFLSQGGEITVEDVVAVPMECGDYDLGANSFEEFEKARRHALRTENNPYGFTQTAAWQIRLACSGWPFNNPPSPTLPTKLPLVWLTADFDFDAPTEWATFAWKRAPNSVLVVRHGDDHVSFIRPDQPATKLAVEYIRTGVLLTPINETLVTIYPAHHARHRTIADPYSVPVGSLAGDVDLV